MAAAATLMLTTVHAAPLAPKDPYGCDAMACGIPPDGAYDQLILGKVAGVGTAKDAQAMFKRLRAARHWQALPENPKQFSQSLIPIVIDSSRGVMTVLMARWEFAEVPLHPGDLVRYSPHNGGVEPPPADSVAHKYWDIDGCVLVLCRAGDIQCPERYISGIYRKRDGVAVAAADLQPLPGVAAIDPETMLVKKPSH